MTRQVFFNRRMEREFEPNIGVYIVVLFFGSILIGLFFGAVRLSPPTPPYPPTPPPPLGLPGTLSAAGSPRWTLTCARRCGVSS